MNEDKLEKYIIDHKLELDTLQAPADLWGKINAQLAPEKKNRSIPYFRSFMMAAAVVFILGMGVIIGLLIHTDLSSQSKNKDYAELEEAENFYIKQANYQLEKLEKLGLDEGEYKADIEQLDEVYHELKIELRKVQDRNAELIINALIYNHQAKIQLLEKIAHRLQDGNQIEKNKTSNHESIEI